MKIAVLGAGALGCLFGAKLCQNNQVVLLTHRLEQANLINHKGLTLRLQDDTILSVRENLSACLSGTCAVPVELLIVLVKTHQTVNALRQNINLITPNTTVLSLQNGLGNFEAISNLVPENNIILGTTNHNSVLTDTGQIFHSGAGITMIGTHHAPDEKVFMVRDLLQNAGFECSVSDNIGYFLWKKLFVNLTLNAFTYITLTPLGFVAQNNYALDFVRKIIAEAVNVAQKEGFIFNLDDVVEWVTNVAAAHPNGFSSMSQDRKKYLKTEIDWINGAVVNLARKHNLNVPYNELVVNLVHALEDADAFRRSSNLA